MVEVVPPRVAGEVDEVELVPAEVAADSGAAEEAGSRIAARFDDLTRIRLDPDGAVGVDPAPSRSRERRRRCVDRPDPDLEPRVGEAVARHPGSQEQPAGTGPQPDPIGPLPGVEAPVGFDDLIEQAHRVAKDCRR